MAYDGLGDGAMYWLEKEVENDHLGDAAMEWLELAVTPFLINPDEWLGLPPEMRWQVYGELWSRTTHRYAQAGKLLLNTWNIRDMFPFIPPTDQRIRRNRQMLELDISTILLRPHPIYEDFLKTLMKEYLLPLKVYATDDVDYDYVPNTQGDGSTPRFRQYLRTMRSRHCRLDSVASDVLRHAPKLDVLVYITRPKGLKGIGYGTCALVWEHMPFIQYLSNWVATNCPNLEQLTLKIEHKIEWVDASRHGLSESWMLQQLQGPWILRFDALKLIGIEDQKNFEGREGFSWVLRRKDGQWSGMKNLRAEGGAY